MTEATGTEYPEEGQPVTTPEPTIDAIEAVEEAAVEAEALDVADAADDFEAEVGTAAEIPVVYNERPVQTVGRRKEAVVRVRLMPGTGKFTLNGKSLETYFPNKLHQQLIREPLVTVEKTERFDIFANLQGGGTSGQAGDDRRLEHLPARPGVAADHGHRTVGPVAFCEHAGRGGGHRESELRGEQLPVGQPADAVRTEQPSHVCDQRLLYCGALRAFFSPYFLRSVARASRVRKPARLSGGRSSASTSMRARAMARRSAPAWPEVPPPCRFAKMSNRSVFSTVTRGSRMSCWCSLFGK